MHRGYTTRKFLCDTQDTTDPNLHGDENDYERTNAQHHRPCVLQGWTSKSMLWLRMIITGDLGQGPVMERHGARACWDCFCFRGFPPTFEALSRLCSCAQQGNSFFVFVQYRHRPARTRCRLVSCLDFLEGHGIWVMFLFMLWDCIIPPWPHWRRIDLQPVHTTRLLLQSRTQSFIFFPGRKMTEELDIPPSFACCRLRGREEP